LPFLRLALPSIERRGDTARDQYTTLRQDLRFSASRHELLLTSFSTTLHPTLTISRTIPSEATGVAHIHTVLSLYPFDHSSNGQRSRAKVSLALLTPQCPPLLRLRLFRPVSHVPLTSDTPTDRAATTIHASPTNTAPVEGSPTALAAHALLHPQPVQQSTRTELRPPVSVVRLGARSLVGTAIVRRRARGVEAGTEVYREEARMSIEETLAEAEMQGTQEVVTAIEDVQQPREEMMWV